MASREEMLAELKALKNSSVPEQGPTREQMLAELKTLREAAKPSKVEAIGRGATQGALMGYADEISGTAQAVFDDMKNMIAGTKDPNAKDPKFDQFGRVTNSNELGGNYKQYRDESRAEFKAAEEAHPNSYKSAELGGSLATAFIPVGSTATIGKAALTGAGLGATNALGNSDSDQFKQVAIDVRDGAAMGAAGGAIGKKLEEGIPLLKRGLNKLSDKSTKEAVTEAVNVASKEAGSIPVQNAEIFENPSTLKEAATSAKNRLKSFFDPKVDPTFEEFAEIARKNGIDPSILPESVKFGPDSSASRAARNLAEGRFGEESLKRFNQTLDKVRGAYDNKILKYSGGAPVDEITAGKILRDSYDEGVSKFFDQMDITHNSVMQMAPGLQMTEKAMANINSSLDGIEKFAKGRMLRGVTDTQRKQAQQLMNAVEAIRAGNGSYKQTVEALRDIGEAAYQSKNTMGDVPVDVQKMRKIYSDLNDGLIDSVKEQLGDDIGNSLVENNKRMSEFFGEKSLVSRVMGDKSIAPENAFRSLLLNGDSQRIEALKKVIPPEKWEYLKGAVLENITKRDPEGNFTFKQLHNSMRTKSSALSSIFSPEELVESAGLVRLGDRFGSPVLSSSGTGASISYKDLWEVPRSLSVDALAIRNANKAADKALNKATEETTKKTFQRAALGEPEAPQVLKDSVSKAAGVLLSKPEKGPEKWANDGAEKLQSHSSKVTPEIINKLKKTRRGQEILFRATHLKPGSPAMDKLLGQINEEAQ